MYILDFEKIVTSKVVQLIFFLVYGISNMERAILFQEKCSKQQFIDIIFLI